MAEPGLRRLPWWQDRLDDLDELADDWEPPWTPAPDEELEPLIDSQWDELDERDPRGLGG